ncbi:HDOD domain-containing protein [Sphaerotilus natans]|nr:HDOD domain-containing protein [Sphaerotilus natans]
MKMLRFFLGSLGWLRRPEESTPETKRALQGPASPPLEPQAPAPAPTQQATPVPDPLTYWHTQRDLRHQLVNKHAPNVPDARALVDLLDSGPDDLIRQLPASAREALALCDDTNLPRSRLVSQLSRDPSLMEAILRTANSSAFSSGREPVLGMEAALDRIGVGNARGVITSSCASNLLSLPGGHYNAMAAQVWAHMIRSGPIAQCLAPALSVNPDEAMTLALLHDVGKLVVFDRLSVLRATRRRSIDLPPDFVQALLSTTHEALGALAAQRWQLGPRAAAAIGNHHRQLEALHHEPLSEALYLANVVSHVLSRNETVDLDEVWTQGALSVPRPRIEAILKRWAAEPV